MNTAILSIVALRAAALALASSDKDSSKRLYQLADLIDAGVATDEHMVAVAEKLAAGHPSQADWDDVFSRISTDTTALQSP